MRLSKTTVDRQGRDLSKLFAKLLGFFACAMMLGTGALPVPASALNIGATRSLAAPAIAGQSNPDVIEVRAVARGGRVAVGPRGNVAVRNTAVVAARGGWARPSSYRWPRGGAIAAGAAIGFVAAATAVTWAGAAPAPGMCWYFTDPSQTQGFWDYCP